MKKSKLFQAILLGIGVGLGGLWVGTILSALGMFVYLCVVIVVCTCYLADILNKMWRGEPPEEDTEDTQE